MTWEMIAISLGLRILSSIYQAEKVLPASGQGKKKKEMVIEEVLPEMPMAESIMNGGDGIKFIASSLLGGLVDRLVGEINRNGGFFSRDEEDQD